jgi:hypothetical protein
MRRYVTAYLLSAALLTACSTVQYVPSKRPVLPPMPAVLNESEQPAVDDYSRKLSALLQALEDLQLRAKSWLDGLTRN